MTNHLVTKFNSFGEYKIFGSNLMTVIIIWPKAEIQRASWKAEVGKSENPLCR